MTPSYKKTLSVIVDSFKLEPEAEVNRFFSPSVVPGTKRWVFTCSQCSSLGEMHLSSFTSVGLCFIHCSSLAVRIQSDHMRETITWLTAAWSSNQWTKHFWREPQWLTNDRETGRSERGTHLHTGNTGVWDVTSNWVCVAARTHSCSGPSHCVSSQHLFCLSLTFCVSPSFSFSASRCFCYSR